MHFFSSIAKLFRPPETTNDVALVLSGGGARGLAHIGAIEELERRGYHVRSVAGTSMGALVGGFYACGQLDALKQKVLGLSRKDIVQLIGFSIGLDHIATGDRLEQLIDTMLGSKTIAETDIDFCCCASDMTSGREHVFREGPLAHAIRASISIPLFFKPVREGTERLVDGSVHNIFPLDRVQRRPNDILVGVNVSGPEQSDDAIAQGNGDAARSDGDAGRKDGDQSVGRLLSLIHSLLPDRHLPSSNYLNMALRVCCVTLQNNTQNAIRLTPPDVLAELPMNSFGLFEFEHAADIIERGRQVMASALDRYEQEQR
jgi:NTE family protein